MSKTKEKQTELQPTYGSFRAKGIITTVEEVKEGESKGRKYKSLKMTLKTDNYGTLRVDVFGMQSKDLQVIRFKGKKVEKKTIKWAERTKIDDGWKISNHLAVGIGFDLKDVKKQGGLTVLASYDAVDKIVDGFELGDSVAVSGSIRFSDFTTKMGDSVVMANYGVQKIYKIEDIDFNDEEFLPFVKFEQNVIIADTEKSDDELSIHGIIVLDKDGNFVNQNFSVSLEKRKNLAKNLSKLPEYSEIPLQGNIINRVKVDESKQEVQGDDDWGFDTQQPTVGDYERFFEVLAADATKIEESKYKSGQFVAKDMLDDDEDDDYEEDSKLEGPASTEDTEDDWFDGE